MGCSGSKESSDADNVGGRPTRGPVSDPSVFRPKAETPGSEADVTEADVLAAQKLWAESIILISKVCDPN